MYAPNMPHTSSNQHVTNSRASVNSANQSGGRTANVLAGHLRPGDIAMVERSANGPIFRVTPGLLISALFMDRQHGEFDDGSPLELKDFEEALRQLRANGEGNSNAARALQNAVHNLKAQQPEQHQLDIYL